MKSYTDIEGWFNFETIYDMAIQQANNNSIFVEIGTYKGKSAAYMAQKIKECGKTIEFYTYDTYGNYINSNTTIEEVENNMIQCDVSAHVILVKNDSLSAAIDFEDNSVDFVFIDGDHTYQAVKKDVETWYKKVKPKGILSGHDYHCDEVKQAVDEFCEAKGYTVSTNDNSWFINKNK